MSAEPNPKSTTPDPSDAQVDRLVERVEIEGGQYLPEVCRAEELYFEHPREGRKPMLAWTCACGWKDSRVVLPYARDPEDAKTKPGSAVACAVCDAATLFPRFAV